YSPTFPTRRSSDLVVRELVARRALDRPVAQRLAGLEDLLDPDVLDALRAQALDVAARVGEAVGMVDAESIDQALADEAQHDGMRGGEHLRVLDADARELVDVEEPTMAPGRLV